MKKFKIIFATVMLSIAIVGGFQVYEHVSLTSVDSFLLANVEALTVVEAATGSTSGQYVSFLWDGTNWNGYPSTTEGDDFPKYDTCRVYGENGHDIECTEGGGNCSWNRSCR